jgi:hypothetical protein
MHRGKIIEEYLRRNKVNLTKLADRLPFTLRTMYRHFEEEDLQLELILDYSEAVDHDFSDQIPEMEALKFRLREPSVPYSIKEKNKLSESDYYRLKYETLLEKYNEMLEQYNKVLLLKDKKPA